MQDYLAREFDAGDPTLVSVFDEVSLWAARFGLLLLEEIPLHPGLRVLDVGCGNGFPLFELAHMLGPSASLWGVDISPPALQRAGLKWRSYELENVILVQADAARLPLRAAQFDLVVSNVGINNFKDAPAVLGECARVSRPDARIALTTNVRGHMREFYEVFRGVLAERDRPRALERLAQEENRRGTRDALCALVESSGFRVTRVIEEESRLRYLNGGAFLRHALTRCGFLEAWRKVLDPGDEESVFAEIEARLDALARARGGLALTVPMLYIEGGRRAAS